MSGKHPPIQIVDEHDNPLRGGTMDEAQIKGLWHRIAGVMVQDSESGEFLLQKVAPNPWYNGGLWNLTASGHVDEGEEYSQAATRELFEEMGIQNVTLTDFSYYQTERHDFKVGKARTYRRHHKVFLVLADKHELTVAPDPAEVEDWAWMSLDQLCSDDIPKTNTLQRFIKDLP